MNFGVWAAKASAIVSGPEPGKALLAMPFVVVAIFLIVGSVEGVKARLVRTPRLALKSARMKRRL